MSIQEKLDATQTTAYKLKDLLSKKKSDDVFKEQQKPTFIYDSRSRTKTQNIRDIQRKQLAAYTKAQEADMQKETGDLIERMREQAVEGNIPEYGKSIIEVLMNYQGKKKKTCLKHVYFFDNSKLIVLYMKCYCFRQHCVDSEHVKEHV